MGGIFTTLKTAPLSHISSWCCAERKML